MVFVDSTNKKLEFWTTGSAFIKTWHINLFYLLKGKQIRENIWKTPFFVAIAQRKFFCVAPFATQQKETKTPRTYQGAMLSSGMICKVLCGDGEMVVFHLFGPPKWQIHGKMEWSFLSPKHMGIITSKNEGCQGSHGFDVSLTKLSDLSPILIGCADASRSDPAREVGRPEGLWIAIRSAFWWMIWEGFFWNYCWWFRNPANQLRLVVYHTIYKGF